MSSAGIDGIAFSPYVGPWRTDGAVLFDELRHRVRLERGNHEPSNHFVEEKRRE
jgi:hypothetical protein